MITATLMGEVLCASYVDHEHGNRICGYRPDTDWQYYYKEKDVVVLKKRLVNSKVCCFMGRGVIDAPLEQVAAYIHHFRNRFSWDQFIVQHEICHQLSENDWLLYMAHVAKRCLVKSKRDFYYYCRTAYVDDKYVQSDISVQSSDYPPRPPYIRAEILQGTGWLLEKYDGSECSTLVSYLAHLDLKELPPVIVNRVLRREPLAIYYIRRNIVTPSSVPPTVASSFAVPDKSVSSDSIDLEVPYEDANPVNYFTNRYSDRNRHFPRSSSSPVYPWVKQTNTDPAELRPKSSTFSLPSSSSGYSIQPLRDDNVTPCLESNPKECLEEVTDVGLAELGPLQDTSPEPTLEAKSSQLTINSQLAPRRRAFSVSLPELDLPSSDDFSDRDGAQPPPPIKSSPAQIQGHQHLTQCLQTGLLAKSSARVMSSSCLSSSL